MDNPIEYAKIVFSAVTTGDWPSAASAVLVLVVALIRLYGKKIHELLPDESPLDKPFWFLLETKPGGWFLNLMTTITGGAGLALLAGQPITWALVKPTLVVSLSGAAIWELIKDLIEWWKTKKVPTVGTPPAGK